MLKGLLTKILGEAGSGLADGITTVANQFIASPEKKMEFEQKMAEVFLDADARREENTTDRWKSDMASDSWLAKNIRPLTLAWFVFSVTAIAIVDSVETIKFAVATEWVDLFKWILEGIILAYFGGRTFEKIKSAVNTKKK